MPVTPSVRIPRPASVPPPAIPAPAPVFVPPPPLEPVFLPPPAPQSVLAPGPAPAPAPVAFVPPPVFLPPPEPLLPAPDAAPPIPPPLEMRGRLRSEDLIADLFEAMHELHFVRDALEGGEFCLSLAMEKVPARIGIVHLYDIDRREFVVTSTRGAGAGRLLLRRHPETDPLLISAMHKRRAVVIAEAASSKAAEIQRYLDVGGAQSLIIAPVMQAGRFLGAIELANPLDGQPFTDREGYALSYIAEQFAELVGKLGVVTDPDKISARALPEA